MPIRIFKNFRIGQQNHFLYINKYSQAIVGIHANNLILRRVPCRRLGWDWVPPI